MDVTRFFKNEIQEPTSNFLITKSRINVKLIQYIKKYIFVFLQDFKAVVYDL